MKHNILGVTLILLITLFLFGCGKNEHEIEATIEDEYDYIGTWIGQVDATSFLVINIVRSNAKEKPPYVYTVMTFGYGLKLGGENNGKITLVWCSNSLPDIREAETKPDEALWFFGGFSNLGIQNNIARRKGKKLILSSENDTNPIEFSREDDYADLLDTIDELKENISANVKKAIRADYPNGEINIIDSSNPPNVVIVK